MKSIKHMVQNITVNELSEHLSSPAPSKPFLVDVREDSEVAVSALPFDLHIPLGLLSERYREIPSDREIVVYCKAGGRSAKAAGFLLQNGFDPSKVKNLEGGITQWAAVVEPGMPVA